MTADGPEAKLPSTANVPLSNGKRPLLIATSPKPKPTGVHGTVAGRPTIAITRLLVATTTRLIATNLRLRLTRGLC